MHWTRDDWNNIIFSDESTFYVLKWKNQCKIWRLEKENLLPECLQQTNTDDGSRVGIWGGISGLCTTKARIYNENINGQLYYDVLQNEVTEFLAKSQASPKMIFQQNLVPWHPSNIVKEKLVNLKLNVFELGTKKPTSKSDRDALINFRQKVGCKADLLQSRSNRSSSRRMD